jgi:hypothetical protein
MSVGAGLGLGISALFSVSSVLAGVVFTPAGWLIRLILLAGFVWAWRSYKNFREELLETNKAGRVLAWITVFITAAAAFLSAALLFL